MAPVILYSRLALAEVVTWALLLTAMVAKYGFGLDWATSIAGGVHGFVFLSYCAVTVAVWVDKQWSWGVGSLGLLSSVVPFCTVPFERGVRSRGLLDGPWTLAPGGRAPRSIPDRVLAVALHRPRLAVAITLAVVAVVFVVLLLAGPPTQWMS